VIRRKAVIFTHIKSKNPLLVPTDFNLFYKELGGFFESCLECDNIAIVYAYISFGIEQFVKAVSSRRKPPVVLPFDVIESEERLHNAFQIATDEALKNLSLSARSTKIPKFVFVGVGALASLLTYLWRRNPTLVKNLAGAGNFTYDSPKFVEAAIRLVRGTHDEAIHPVIRIDADVEVNRDAIQEIIDQSEQLNRRVLGHPYWWFSGCYAGNFPGDPVNEHAVRQHWLIDPDTRVDPKQFRLVQHAETFLRDLGELGATQIETTAPCSAACQSLIQRRGGSVNRPIAQAISGAGLVASTQAIRRLPPFMNAEEMIVWIDDHLKRQLHEAIGDIDPNDPERISTAKLKQNRYPQGIEPKDIAFAPTYFERLLGGCLLHAMIKDLRGLPGPLAKGVRSVISNQPLDESILYGQLLQAAAERLADVLEVWSKADYGDELLSNWARSLRSRAKKRLCNRAANVGLSYIKLLQVWGDYVNTIQSLDALDAYWLFTRVYP
jgi:hypothetical protein